jgi:hypothetical protein
LWGVLMNLFRYVDRAETNCVELRLFKSAEGNPQGDVSGPVFGFPNGTFSDVLELVRCSTLDDAFQAGIRMANKNDAELVISGSPELWLAKWGVLDQSPTVSMAQTKAAR